MATLTDEKNAEFRRMLHREALDLLQAESPPLTKPELKAGFQAIEDFWEASRVSLKADMVSAIGKNISSSLAKKMGRFWLQHKWGLE